MNNEDLITHFVELYRTEIIFNDIIEDENIFVCLADETTCYIYDIRDVFNVDFKPRFLFDTSIKKTIYSTKVLRFTKYSNNTIIFPFLEWTHPYSYLQQFNHLVMYFKNYKKTSFIVKLQKVNNKYYMVYYGNKLILKNILSNKRDYRTVLFINVLYNDINEKNTKECILELNSILDKKPSANTLDSKNELRYFLKDSVKLYNYQENDIHWMKSIQNKIDNGDNIISMTHNMFNKVILDDNIYMLYNSTLIPGIYNENNLKLTPTKYYGGNIISEVGLGKTLIVLCYIVMNSNNEYNTYIEFDNEKCNYFYKRGRHKGLNCVKNKSIDEDLYCKEHINTLFIDKRAIKLKNIDSFHLRDHIVEIKTKTRIKHYFKTNASLIICPNQLCDQWVREYYDKFKQTDKHAKRVLLVVTYDQYKNVTFADILFADIIIISYNFLLNANYYKKCVSDVLNYRHYKRRNIIDILDDIDKNTDKVNEITDKVNDITDNEIIDKNVIMEKFLLMHHDELNVFDNFYFQSIYLDESHEILSMPRGDILNKIIQLFVSKYKWNITATPFVHGTESFIHLMNFICDINEEFYLNKDSIEKSNILFRRNTRKSIIDEFNGNVITDTVRLLDFTEQERSIYNAHIHNNTKANRDFLIKLCCDTSIDIETRNLVKNCKTFNEIQNVILANTKKKLSLSNEKMNTYNNNISNLSKIIDRGFIIDERDEYNDIFESIDQVKSEISILRRKLTNEKKEYDSINRTYIYLKNAVDNIKTIETCPICLDDIQTDEIAITKCGHKFCKSCIYHYIDELVNNNSIIKCPKCNIEMLISDIYLLKDNPDISTLNLNNELVELIQRTKSTKIGHIIHYIKTEMKDADKCIIFSQWDSMLTKVGKLLKKENINVLYCSGTVYKRKNAIKNFQENVDANIICLSSEHCASGINLTAANKIIFIEPIYGDKEYRKNIENQAIGRVDRLGQQRPIEIIRFIIKDSIEEEILNSNNSNNSNNSKTKDENKENKHEHKHEHKDEYEYKDEHEYNENDILVI